MNLIDEIESQQGALTIDWLAKKLNISKKTLYRMAKNGKLPCFSIGGSVRLNPKSVAEWLRRRGMN